MPQSCRLSVVSAALWQRAWFGACIVSPMLTAILVLSLLLSCPAGAAELEADVVSSQPVGTTVEWTLTGEGSGTEVFRLDVGLLGEPETERILYDFREDNVFRWTPIDEGNFVVRGFVRDRASGAVSVASKAFTTLPVSAVALTEPVVTPTWHPLVVLYSIPPCAAPLRVRAHFVDVAAGVMTKTHTSPCRPGHTVSFYLGGMRPATSHLVWNELIDPQANRVAVGSSRVFRTAPASLPPLAFPSVPPGAATSVTERLLLQSPVPPGNPSLGLPPFPHAVDLAGRLVWFAVPALTGTIGVRPGGQGTFYYTHDNFVSQRDLLDNVVRETTTLQLRDQLEARGLDLIEGVHHEARPLPNGHLAVLGSVLKLVDDARGGEVLVAGDMVLVLDANLQVVWTWNAFDHLDVEREATLGDLCPPGMVRGCPEGALDWTHSNTVTWSPADQNLLVSVRNQDWIVKIDYRNGAGDGHVIWRLGPEGDFALSPPDPDGWFSHIHDPNFVTPSRLVVYDNSNVRCEGVPGCRSRGQVLELDEQNLVATLVLNVDLAEYADALGSSQPLANGNVFFGSGTGEEESRDHRPPARVSEFTPGEALVYAAESPLPVYRSHRLPDLYLSDLGFSGEPEQGLGELEQEEPKQAR